MARWRKWRMWRCDKCYLSDECNECDKCDLCDVNVVSDISNECDDVTMWRVWRMWHTKFNFPIQLTRKISEFSYFNPLGESLYRILLMSECVCMRVCVCERECVCVLLKQSREFDIRKGATWVIPLRRKAPNWHLQFGWWLHSNRLLLCHIYKRKRCSEPPAKKAHTRDQNIS